MLLDAEARRRGEKRGETIRENERSGTARRQERVKVLESAEEAEKRALREWRRRGGDHLLV